VDSIKDLTEMQMSAIAEIGNIGAGNAATALSKIVSKAVNLSVPKVQVLPINDAMGIMGDPEALVAGVYLAIEGDIDGDILLIFTAHNSKNLASIMMGGMSHPDVSDDEGVFSEIEISALKELGNILSSSYLNSLADFTQMTIGPSVPGFCCDMAGAILSVALIEVSAFGDNVLILQTNFDIEGQNVEGFFLLVPKPGSLEKIFTALGVG
jgi:chemotaxis protein CheC